MNIPPPLSDQFVDDVATLFFCALPSMDPDELSYLIESVLQIAAREMRRAVAEERQSNRERIEKVSLQ